MRGYRSPYVPGWDTHGLPIELRVLKEEGKHKEEVPPEELRERCQAYAEKFIDVQRDEFRRLGGLGDWENPYITFKPEYEAAQLGVFAEMVDRGLVYKGHKPVYWCIDCQTALATAEIEYEDEKSPSIFVAYPLLEGVAGLEEKDYEDLFVVIWTTTPWTLPASMAVALHPAYEYVIAQVEDGRKFMVAKELLESFCAETGLSVSSILKTFPGRQAEHAKARHPFIPERILPLVLADYVILDQGTGCVHTAPGHGVEDFETGIRYGLEVYNPVDDKGVFKPGTPLVANLSIHEGSKVILETLQENGTLLRSRSISHSYPHCWRCKKPVIFRSTEQWFVSVEAFREKALEEIDNVQWIPGWGKERISNMVRERSDWCISRQRIWGIPIPAFYCQDCGSLVLTGDRVRAVQEQVRTHGSNFWWTAPPEELLGDLAFCPKCNGKHLVKDRDIMDVWFDSGISHVGVLETREDLRWPADLYLEGSDQHRGWFQTSLLTSVAVKDKAPYKAVLTHGFIVDGDGRKMSKSLGNVIAPQEIIDAYGADILRLWVASTDYRNDVRISKTIIANLVEMYRRIRNTARFLLGNLGDFNPGEHRVPLEELTELDRWISMRFQQVLEKATRGFEDYEFHVPTFVLHQFCVNEVSSILLDTAKDRLYVDGADDKSRRSAQTVIWELLLGLTKVLAPILSFTAEEIWQEMRTLDPELEESVFLALWPEVNTERVDPEFLKTWESLLEVRQGVSRALEKARSGGSLGHSLEAAVYVQPSSEHGELLKGYGAPFWEEFCIISRWSTSPLEGEGVLVHQDEESGLSISVAPAHGTKCPRCWKYTEDPQGEEALCPRCARVMESLEA
jgi:isoleucyl-tRNA synthetase